MPMIYRLLIIVANFALSSSFQNQHSFLPATSRIQGTAVETPEDTINNAKGVLVRVNPIKRLQVTIPASPISITSADIDSHIKANPVLDYELKNVVNFVTLGGVQPGNVAVCDWTSVHLEGGTGFAQNQNMKGVAKNGHEIDVNFEQPEPWATFARKLVGSGQMQTTTFEASFPDTYPVERMKNVRARFTVNVKKIMEKVPIEKRDISEADLRKEVEGFLEGKAMEKQNVLVDLAVREEIMERYVVDLDAKKATESVSWAKFGKVSGAQFQWQLVLETICKQQETELGRKVEVKDLYQILRDKAEITFM